ncbi:MAG: AAA family ATPase, partial [Bacillota bacterium]
MQKRPLAYRIRPKSLDDVVGQDHLVGENGVIRKMVENGQFFSLILYGKPGIGKTTIATVVGEAFGLNTFTFNASTDSKASL